jgi:hypothetical protein
VDRREEEEKEGADTALKTKPPHVNVGPGTTKHRLNHLENNLQ